MDHTNQLREAFYRYINNQSDVVEAKAFLEHMHSGKDQEVFLTLLEECFERPLPEDLASRPEIIAVLDDTYMELHGQINGISAGTSGSLAVSSGAEAEVKLWPGVYSSKFRIVVAAAVAVFVLGLGLWFFNKEIFGSAKEVVYASDVAPGGNTATLTLANGKTIALSDTKTGIVIDASVITYNDGTKVRISSGSPSLGPKKGGQSITSPVEDHELYTKEQLTASTPRGGQYQVILPDGTKVWLNAASSLKFPAAFTGAVRVVELRGEAYFEVAKVYKSSLRGTHETSSGQAGRSSSERVPFLVKTDKQLVEVLGTHFNINSYAEEGLVKTTLLEGSVRVSNNNKLPKNQSSLHNNEVILKPNQQAVSDNNGIKVAAIDPELAVAWKNNLFIFESDDIRYIMRMIGRWYDVDVVYEGEIPDDKFGGSVSRFKNVSEVLKSLEATGKVKFKIEGRRIMVRK